MKILITGGTGFVGSQLVKLLLKNQHEVFVVTRKKLSSKQKGLTYICWESLLNESSKSELLFMEAIIHLAGENIGAKRWSPKQQEVIINSRIETLQQLWQFYALHPNNQLKTLITASGVGYYGAITQEKKLDEQSSLGNDFLAHVCDLWEQAAFNFESMGVRVVCLRKGLVFGKKCSVLQKIAKPIRLGFGAVLGSGTQIIPYIHNKDLCQMYLFVLTNPKTRGVYNAVAGNISQETLTNAIAHKFKKTIWLPNIPNFFLRLVLGKMAMIILEGTSICNEKIKSEGFQFKYDTFSKTLRKSF